MTHLLWTKKERKGKILLKNGNLMTPEEFYEHDKKYSKRFGKKPTYTLKELKAMAGK